MMLRWITLIIATSISMSLHGNARLLHPTKYPDVVPSCISLAHKKYNEVTWLTAHNAYSYYWRYKTYAQQSLDFAHQWQAGVRAFMIDLYWTPTAEQAKHKFAIHHKVRGSKQELVLCHGSYGLTKYLQTFREPQTFASWLQELKTILEDNPSEIATFFIESYTLASPDKTIAAEEARNGIISAIKNAGLYDMLFYPDRYTPGDHIINWPTIGTMLLENKRIVIFSDNRFDAETIYTVATQENVYNLAAKNNLALRTDNRSNDANLMVFNHFHSFSLTDLLHKAHNRATIEKRIVAIEERYGMTPNFVALNFIQEEGRNKTQSIQSLIRDMNDWLNTRSAPLPANTNQNTIAEEQK